MFEVEKTFSFEAGHALSFHDGKCVKPHGHSYSISVVVRKKELQTKGPKSGMVMDFHDISNVVKPMIEKYFDHCWLNESLKTESPTAEFIAKWIFEYLKPHIDGLWSVSVSETKNSKATYFE
jgi:6-pyruvoyltetrahydropterin/6-carboxytetrahydropterin synthase